MVQILRRKRLNVPVAPLLAAGLAMTVAISVALVPAGMLDTLVTDSGIAALIPAAEPPLGLTARLALMLMGGGATGLIVWLGLHLLVGSRSVALFGKRDALLTADVPVLRRADAHPDAPARRPLFAQSDLGTPFLEVRAPVALSLEDAPEAVAETAPEPAREIAAIVPAAPVIVVPPVEADLPTDLDQPLAKFDPHAIPEKPLDWFVPAAPAVQPLPVASQDRPQTFAPTERFETFELRPATTGPKRARTDADPSATIHSLLDRLEKSVARREPAAAAKAPLPPRHDSLQEALSTLRKLAAR